MVNVNDIKTAIPEPTPENQRLEIIFNRQRELMEKYHKIEENNGLLQTPMVPVDLHDRMGQSRLKDFAWRFTEELTESTRARYDHPDNPTHEIEELSDAYHFLIEFTILCGLDPLRLWRQICDMEPTIVKWYNGCILSAIMDWTRFENKEPNLDRHYLAIEAIGTACNCLKNKPWKSTHMMTDKPKFFEWVCRAHIEFYHTCSGVGLDGDKLYRIYFLKSEVNKFRQRSNY